MGVDVKQSHLIRAEAETESGEKIFGLLTVLAFDANGIPAGCYIANGSGMPFAYRVKPESIFLHDNFQQSIPYKYHSRGIIGE